MQRTKGATFEREIAKRFSLRFGRVVRRRLGQARDAGHDLDGMEPYIVECKRRARLGPMTTWLRQAVVASPSSGRPVVVARGDGDAEPVAILPLWVLEDLLMHELYSGTPPLSPSPYDGLMGFDGLPGECTE